MEKTNKYRWGLRQLCRNVDCCEEAKKIEFFNHFCSNSSLSCLNHLYSETSSDEEFFESFEDSLRR